MTAPAPDPAPSSVDAFWQVARVRARLNPTGYYAGERPLGILPPPAWSFGATPDQADELLALVLSGTKTATASALWDYDAEGEELPAVGDLGIVTDGRGVPRALIATTRVETVPFEDVDAEHAELEGEGDRSLTHWREAHQRFFSEHAVHEHGFSPEMPVVLERFAVLYSAPADPVSD